MSLDGFIPDTIQKGPCRWKLNLFSSLQKWWDAGKEKIKGLAVRFSLYRKKTSLQGRSLLSNLASHRKGKIDSGVVSQL